MGIDRPYRRCYRPGVNSGQAWSYIQHPLYATDPQHFIRSFELIQKDFINLLEYIEPSDVNLPCHSFRIYELLVRVCVEVEANFKAILLDNACSVAPNGMNIQIYHKVNQTHRLSKYVVRLPVWAGSEGERAPFKNWDLNHSLRWYQAYNKVKHDRHGNFEEARFEFLVDAMCGLFALLTAQFYLCEFRSMGITWEDGVNDGMQTGIGDYFRIKIPDDWPDSERYVFNWNDLSRMSDPFQKFNYDDT